jgi:CRISPR system Cascade subunit CasE
MWLHRFHINPRSREARRDLADPYQMHATLCRAFSSPTTRCPEGEFLWRLEPETDDCGNPRVLVQSRSNPDWSRIGVEDWFYGTPDPGKKLETELLHSVLREGRRYRFRLRGNPCVTRNGKRLGHLSLTDQEAWISRKGQMHGFAVESVLISQERMLRGRKHGGVEIRIYSVLYEGVLVIIRQDLLLEALQKGIGHGKALGLGLLSLGAAR